MVVLIEEIEDDENENVDANTANNKHKPALKRSSTVKPQQVDTSRGKSVQRDESGKAPRSGIRWADKSGSNLENVKPFFKDKWIGNDTASTSKNCTTPKQAAPGSKADGTGSETSNQDVNSQPQQASSTAERTPATACSDQEGERRCAGCSGATHRKLECPKCLEKANANNDQSLRCFYCSHECFKKSWGAHKRKFHAKDLPPQQAAQAKPSITDEPGLAAAALMLQQGMVAVAEAADLAKAGPPLQNAALRYEQAIRIFRQASEVCMGGPAGASMNLQLLRAEAKAWRSVAYVRTMIGDDMIPAGIDAYLKATAMYKSLGMVREVGICVADMGRVRLAEGNIPQAGRLLSNASRLLKMDVVGGDKLEAGAALQYVGELKVQIHLQNPDGWEKCKSGHDEDVDLVQTAIEDLEAAQEIFVAKSDAIPSKVLSGIRWSMGQAQLLVGSIDKAKELIRQALSDESWKTENQHETQQAEALLGRLSGTDKKNTGR